MSEAKPGDVYRKAAERVAIGISWLSCCAITNAARRGFSYQDNDVQRYAELFKPRRYPSIYWFGNQDSPRTQNHRVIALCFMAAIADAGDA